MQEAQHGSCMLSFGICQVGHAVKCPVENAVPVDQDQLQFFICHDYPFLSAPPERPVRRSILPRDTDSYSSILVT